VAAFESISEILKEINDRLVIPKRKAVVVVVTIHSSA
jgi:hypothetical protein